MLKDEETAQEGQYLSSKGHNLIANQDCKPVPFARFPLVSKNEKEEKEKEKIGSTVSFLHGDVPCIPLPGEVREAFLLAVVPASKR